MSVIKIVCVVGVLFITNIAYGGSVEKSKIFRKQEQVLLELADEGVVESYRVLAAFYNNHASRRNDYLNKSIQWRIKAAQFGHVFSLYRLGQFALNFPRYQRQLKGAYIEQASINKKWRSEALIFIGMAAILGNRYARTDLVMLPKTLAVSYQEIDMAVNEALVRLQQGELINCNFFVCKADNSDYARNRQLLSYQTAVTAFKQEQKRLKCQKMKRCLELMLAKVKFIDQGMIVGLKTKSAYENRSKIEKNLRLHKEASGKLTASWEQQSNLDRNQQRTQAAKEIVDHYADADRQQLKARISELLEKINYHRSSAHQIKPSDIMEILSQP